MAKSFKNYKTLSQFVLKGVRFKELQNVDNSSDHFFIGYLGLNNRFIHRLDFDPRTKEDWTDQADMINICEMEGRFEGIKFWVEYIKQASFYKVRGIYWNIKTLPLWFRLNYPRWKNKYAKRLG